MKEERMGYIYCGYRIETRESYIGKTVELNQRIALHKRAQEKNHFHKAIRRYGIESFAFEILEVAPESILFSREMFWISAMDTFKGPGYNLTPGGEGQPCGNDHFARKRKMRGEKSPKYGTKVSEEIKEKTRGENHYTHKLKMEGKPHPGIGSKRTKETREKISGENHYSYKLKIEGKPHPNLGSKRTKESRQKMSDNHADVSGEKNPMYGIRKFGEDNPNYGNDWSFEQREKASIFEKNRTQQKRIQQDKENGQMYIWDDLYEKN